MGWISGLSEGGIDELLLQKKILLTMNKGMNPKHEWNRTARRDK